MQSTVEQARAAIAGLRARTTASPWRIDRGDLADRLDELVGHPGRVRQDALNLCGPAALLRVWLAEDPLAVARFASSLYETGEAWLGDIRIRPGRDSLLKHDYAAVKARVEAARTAPSLPFCPVAEWMMMGAIRDSENGVVDFEGLPDEMLAGPSGLTTPGELDEWLRATDLYDARDTQANAFFTKGLPHAKGLRPGARDVLLLINAHMLSGVAVDRPATSGAFLVNAFPNHWVVLNTPITETADGIIEFGCWTSGADVTVRVPRRTFEANYYGAITARLAAYDVVISELAPDPMGDDLAFNAGEFVRLDNLGTRTADVTGWCLRDRANHRLRIPPGHEIAPGGSLFVHTGAGDPSVTRYFARRRKAIWNNRGGDTASLMSANGRLIDTFSYEISPASRR
jgi:hypothetical protein